uniref:Uncharacterized protein n=1 Tax=Anguilla anguilla TaxID=7936 RepID=A0A0E9XKE0_ANGAN
MMNHLSLVGFAYTLSLKYILIFLTIVV